MIISINKPAGITSHDVIYKVRKFYGIKKVGHAGTLDPFAEGVLVVMIGRESTKMSYDLMKKDKEYMATLKLGYTTDTLDKDGEVKEFNTKLIPKLKDIKNIIKKYIGKDISQIPPMYSAIKIKGKKLYELARQGKNLELEPRIVNIYDINLLKYNYPILKIKVKCGSGTYIRSLARDIGKDLLVGAYLEALIRTKSGSYFLEDSYSIDNLPELKLS